MATEIVKVNSESKLICWEEIATAAGESNMKSWVVGQDRSRNCGVAGEANSDGEQSVNSVLRVFVEILLL